MEKAEEFYSKDEEIKDNYPQKTASQQNKLSEIYKIKNQTWHLLDDLCLVDYETKQRDPQTQKALKSFKSIFKEKDKWNLSSGKWKRLKLDKVFENVSVVSALSIEFTSNKQPQLIHSLSYLDSFPWLKCLKLGNNNITSIQKLTFTEFPMLEELILSDNNITSIKALNKMSFQGHKIKTISFYANRVLDIHVLTKIKWVKKHNSKSPHKDYAKNSQNQRQEQGENEQNKLSLLFGINHISDVGCMNKFQLSSKNLIAEELSIQTNQKINLRDVLFGVELNKQSLNYLGLSSKKIINLIDGFYPNNIYSCETCRKKVIIQYLQFEKKYFIIPNL